MSLSEKSSHHNPDAHKTNGTTRPLNETPETPSSSRLIDLVIGANFLDFPRDDRREVSRIYRNGGPQHLMTVRWKKGIIGESVEVHAHGETGPTVIDVADYKPFSGEREDRLEAIWIEGRKGEGREDLEQAVEHLEAIFPDYTFITETMIDGSGNRFVDGIPYKDGIPPNAESTADAIMMKEGESSVIAS